MCVTEGANNTDKPAALRLCCVWKQVLASHHCPRGVSQESPRKLHDQPHPACNVFISWWLKMTKPCTAWPWLSLMDNSSALTAYEKHCQAYCASAEKNTWPLSVPALKSSPSMMVEMSLGFASGVSWLSLLCLLRPNAEWIGVIECTCNSKVLLLSNTRVPTDP